jgi:hypothetical protein
MALRVPDPVSERRLDELRVRAEREGFVPEAGVRPAGAPIPRATPHAGYYGLPLLKRPVWTWEVPVYFFVGGTAGAAAMIAAAARAAGAPERLVRDARWMAAAGSALSPPLLIADLGRPERFLNMLRVFKLQSPMSVGAWTLVAFSTASAAATFAGLISARAGNRLPVRIVRDAAEGLSAATGLAMSTYTGVLIGATAIPAWAQNVRLLPVHFGASSLAAAASVLELAGHRHPALNALGAGAALVETLAAIHLERQKHVAFEPLKRGRSGAMVRVAELLSGPIPLALRLFGGRSAELRRAAAVSSLAGSLLTRVAWLEAGRASADDPRVPLGLSDVAAGAAPLAGPVADDPPSDDLMSPDRGRQAPRSVLPPE